MEVNYQVFIDIFSNLILIAFPLALVIGLVEKISTTFFDFVFGRNLKL